MPIDNNLNFNFTAVDQAAIHNALDAALLVFNQPTTPYVNLTNKERQETPSIDAKRLHYVYDAVNNILPVFTGLASPSIPLPRTTTLFQLVSFIHSVVPKMAELHDRITDLGINAENLVYTSMTDSYDSAKRQEGRMPGADVLIAAISPLFADQGSNAEEPPLEDPAP
jgi:hypothetical protein